MIFKETGFRPYYHNVVALELNDMLRDLVKDCPDAKKSSHAVFYGYIDPKKGMMLELLGCGKQAPKYFYFKDPYEGRRVSIKISKVADVETIYFPDLENRFNKKYQPRIDKLKKYEASEKVEESRGFDFLDPLREPNFPDDVKVCLLKDGLDIEECWVRIVDLAKPSIIGVLLNQPYQDFGKNKGDAIAFGVHEVEEGRLVCIASFDVQKYPKEFFEGGKAIKDAIKKLHENNNEENFGYAIEVIRSSDVFIPCDSELSEDAQQILEKLREDGRDTAELSAEEEERLNQGISLVPLYIQNSENSFIPAFSSEDEFKGEKDLEDIVIARMSFESALYMAKNHINDIAGIVVNPYSDNFLIPKDLFDLMIGMESLVEGEKDSNENDEEESDGPETIPTISDINRTLSFCDGGKGLGISVGKMDLFNYALYQNDIHPIRDIKLINNTNDPMTGLALRIESDYEFFKTYEAALPPIPPGKPIAISDPDLVIRGKVLAEMTETVNANVNIEIRRPGETVCAYRGKIMVLAYDQWQGDTSYQDLLPAFVLPNHPAIPALLHEASDRLKKWGKDSSLEGYQRHDPNRVRDMAAAAYAAIQKKNIIYANPPASFSIAGQRIRTPEMVLDQHMGTCMDMTLLYAAVLEAMGLHPLLVLIKGHIFAGVWLRERSKKEILSGNVVIENLDELRKRINTGTDDLTFIECTAMCSDKKVTFEEAEKTAKLLHINDFENFEFAIDVYVSRIYGIKPMPSRVSNSGVYTLTNIKDLEDDDITEAPKAVDISVSDVPSDVPGKIMNKKDLWESKLLDLSLHNMLLNLSKRSQVMPIMSSHIDQLEDALADGHEFHLLPEAEWITDIKYTTVDKDGKESKPKQWLADIKKQIGVYEITDWPAVRDFNCNDRFLSEYRNHKLYTFSSSKTLDRELTHLYRASRASQQENGVSSLYLAIGLLRWFVEPGDDTPCYAPLILLPIEIVRKSANQGYALHARDEEPHFNTTLLELLKQIYNIEITGLDPLPADEHGIDIKKTFSIVRNAVLSIKNWDVVESCAIGNFSFAQFAMWNDIHTAGDMLENSKIVRSLMKGHIDWDIDTSTNYDEKSVYLPITVDATQLKAIKMADNGETFVLHGPPGTGKSQTITGMIANLIAHGKSVLFVAEKMAALSVVEKRLTSLGLGDFCLELHSDKANKKHVLGQLSKTLSIHRPIFGTDFDDYLKKEEQSRQKLDVYAKHLHEEHNCGYSLRELIDMYEDVRNVDDMIRFNVRKVSEITKEDISNHVPLIRQLMADGVEIDNIKDNPLSEVSLTSYNAEVRLDLFEVADSYYNSLEKVRKSAGNASVNFDMNQPVTMGDLRELKAIADLYYGNKDIDSDRLLLTEANVSAIKEFYDKKEASEKDKAIALTVWRPGFLVKDIDEYQIKYNNAEKKIFGRSFAIDALVTELEAFANSKISFEQIPSLLLIVSDYKISEKEMNDSYNRLESTDKKTVGKYDSFAAFKDAFDDATDYRQNLESFPGGIERLQQIAINADEKTISQFRDDYEYYITNSEKLNSLIVRNTVEDTGKTIDDELAFLDELTSNPAALKDWANYNRTRQDCIKAGLQPVVDAYENDMEPSKIINSYKKGLYYALINEIIVSDSTLSNFSGATFNESIRQFKRLDDSMIEQTKGEIFHQMALRIPTGRDTHEMAVEMNLLRKAIASNARGMSIRDLFTRVPHVIKALCPCMLMSPNSVAQYLDQKSDMFDVVIFDEASQLPTCKSVGALARAKNAVIVGDPKQMPPTSFFAGSGPEVNDLALDDMDSILDDALALGIPSQYLQWHYRSTHESLIAFSNNEFYGNKMFTFPSANDRERHVKAVHVDGIYSGGTNTKEAEAVVAEVIRRFNNPKLKKQSVGIVTFNIKQQKLIEDLLAIQFQKNTELDEWANTGEDPIFVKNLENVQGDERDAILFSIGYGPDEKGRISMNFGPINKSGGGKRLNVAFSRSRVSMTIFSSIRSTDLRITPSTPEGVIAFRDFLKFAEGKGLGNDDDVEKKIFNREGILKAICKEIEKNGYGCETMVGKSDFHVDIAVLDPFDPNNYLAGIMLDGDMYKLTNNTRDRELAQIGVLERLGWKIYRIWAMDWWDNRKKEIFKLMSELEELKVEAEKRAERLKEEELKRKAEEEAQAEEERKIKAELEVEAARVIKEEEAEEKQTAQETGDTEQKHITEKSIESEPEPVSEPVTETDTEPEIEKEIEDIHETVTEPVEVVNDKDDTETHLVEIQDPVEYVNAQVPEISMTLDEFTSVKGRANIENVIGIILEAEAPILKDALIRKVMASCSINRSGAAVEAVEKAMKHMQVKTSKTKGVVFCWTPGQDPKEYKGIRISNDRSGDEISPQEISNAACYVLKSNIEMSKDDLIKEVSRVFGYKRLGKNLEAALAAGLQFARTTGAIKVEGGKYRLN